MFPNTILIIILTYAKSPTFTETTLEPIRTSPVGNGHKVPPALQANLHFGRGMYSPLVSEKVYYMVFS